MKSWIRKPIAAYVAVAIALGGGIYLASDSSGPSDPTAANLWVDTSGGTCARQSPAGTYSDAGACGSLATAYAAASPGDAIKIKDGSYGSVTVAYRSGMSGSPVTVTGSDSVTFTDVDSYAANIVYDFTGTKSAAGNMTARSFDVGNPAGTRATDVVLDGVNVDAQDTTNLNAIRPRNVTGLTIRNSRIGNTMSGTGSSDTAKSIETGQGSSDYAADLLIQDSYIYDADTPTGSSAHLECIFASGVQGMTIRRVQFEDCTFFDIFVTVQNVNGQAQPTDILIEDSILGDTKHPDDVTEWGYALNWHADVTNPADMEIRRNTIEGAVATNFSGTPSNVVFDSNIVAEGIYQTESTGQGCKSGVTFTYNVKNNSCGTNTVAATEAAIRANWTDPDNEDFTLSSAAASAVGAGNPATTGTTDFAGNARDSDPDSGALEYQSGGGGGGSTANLWVDTDGGTCTRQSSAATYSTASACGTLDAALDAASASDTVRIKNGTYGAQSMSGAKAVTFIGESKSGVVFTDTVGLVANMSLQDVTVLNESHGFSPFSPADGVTLTNVDVLGDYITQLLWNIDNFSWIGGEFGDFDGSIQERHCSGSATPDNEPLWISNTSTNVLIEDVHFSGAEASEPSENGCPSNDNFHLEIWRVDGAAANVTFRRNVIDTNGSNSATIFISSFGGGVPTNLDIVGNLIGAGLQTSIEMGNAGASSCAGYLIAYNTFRGNSYGTYQCTSYTGTRFVGNLGSHASWQSPSCAQVQWIANVRESANNSACTGGDDTGNTWVSGSDFSVAGLGLSSDGHLNAGSAAIEAGETPGASDVCTDTAIMGSPVLDVDGGTRPFSTDCDAGADEYGSP